MIVKLKADVIFEAENIDDAFEKWRDHFTLLMDGEPSDLILGGEIEMYPVKEDEDGE